MIVDTVFTNYARYPGAASLFAIYAFAFQVFCDFAGYSNIARGLGKVMGFNIVVNFNIPYFAINPSDFWKRWHISLSSWLKEYLYIPLGGNRKGTFITYRNLALTMLLGGLWHGAAWTFIIWGAYHGLLLIIYRLAEPLTKRIPEVSNKLLNKAWYFIRALFFFHLVCIGWLFFRAQSISQATEMFQKIIFNFGPITTLTKVVLIKTIFITSILLIVQVFQFAKKDLLVVYRSHWSIKMLFYAICFLLIAIYGVTGGNEFIYFQF